MLTFLIELDLSLLQEQQQQQSHAGCSSQHEEQPMITIEVSGVVRSSGAAVGEDTDREIGNEGSNGVSPGTSMDGDFDDEEPYEKGNDSVSPVGGLGPKNPNDK